MENMKIKNAEAKSVEHSKQLAKPSNKHTSLNNDSHHSKRGINNEKARSFAKNFEQFRSLSKQKDEQDQFDKLNRKYPSKPMLSTDESVNEDEAENEGSVSKEQVYTQTQWLKILKNNDLDNTCHAEMMRSLRHGIPEELRPQIWCFLARVDQLKKQHAPGFYQKLINLPSHYDEQIRKDIDRTFSDHPFFNDKEKRGQKMLFNVLRAYAHYDKEIGYTQGMNFIAGMLLIVLDSNNYKNSNLPYLKNYEARFDEDAFWIFLNIEFVKNYRVIYKREFPKLMGMLKNLEQRVKTKAPEVDKHIHNHGLETFICFHQMFLSMMLVYNPIEISKRIIDLFLIEEENVLFKVIMKAISLCKREILQQNDPEKLRNFLNQQMMYKCHEKCKDKLYTLFPSPESTD